MIRKAARDIDHITFNLRKRVKHVCNPDLKDTDVPEFQPCEEAALASNTMRKSPITFHGKLKMSVFRDKGTKYCLVRSEGPS